LNNVRNLIRASYFLGLSKFPGFSDLHTPSPNCSRSSWTQGVEVLTSSRRRRCPPHYHRHALFARPLAHQDGSHRRHGRLATRV
jgi:hypothetical protein